MLCYLVDWLIKSSQKKKKKKKKKNVADRKSQSHHFFMVRIWQKPKPNRYKQGCDQRCKVFEIVLPWIPVLHDERQQEQGSRAKRSRVTCIFDRSPGPRNNAPDMCLSDIALVIRTRAPNTGMGKPRNYMTFAMYSSETNAV